MEKREKRKLFNKRKAIIIVLLLIGFGAMEFPGIFFVMVKVEPFILGMPFLYGYLFCWWFYMCMVIFYAYRTGWGKHSFFRKREKKHI